MVSYSVRQFEAFLTAYLFFFNDTATTEIYTLSLHDALPISPRTAPSFRAALPSASPVSLAACRDRKSTRLNSSHGYISYAVFCLKKKNKQRSVPSMFVKKRS